MPDNFINKFNSDIKNILISAEKIATEAKVSLDTEHLLLALANSKNNLASAILLQFEITPERISLISALLDRQNKTATSSITDMVKRAIQISVQTASFYHHLSINAEHLLYGLVSGKAFNSFLIIERIGVDPLKIKNRLKQEFEKAAELLPKRDISAEIISGDPASFPVNPLNSLMGGRMSDEMIDASLNFPPQIGEQNPRKESILELYTVNLTKAAKNNELDPVIGRETETERIIQTLSRRTKNNPILIGEPGVGKTAIVDGLAHRIVKGDVPPKLTGAEILSIDLGSLLAGTMYRGQFESRIKKLLAEIKKKGNIILFVDEIHMLVGAGATEGSIDAANLLKPMLARGELRLIGSTTFDEYKKYIEKDSAFERRFQQIKVVEPSVTETIKILDGIKSRYEKHHHVKYTIEAIGAAATLSKRYISDRFLPDKAIDLLDEAGSAKNSKERISSELSELKIRLRKILKEKDELIAKEQFAKASELKVEESKIEKKIEEISMREKSRKEKTVTDDDIASLVSNWTGVPVSTLTKSEKKRYLNLEKGLKKYIIGQDQAVLELAKAIKRARVGISNSNRPIGSFLFLGPTGVGKSELAKVLARELLGDENSLVKIDMSEFMERHNVSRLVGAPAGYIGYEEGGKLTEIVRKNPYSIILLDEIEKAHPEVFNILLQIMEDGVLTDAKGRKVDFKNTILIMTSNLGTEIIGKGGGIGFSRNGLNDYDQLSESVTDSVNNYFKPEFLNRLDRVIIFYPLKKAAIDRIVDLQLDDLKKRLLENGYKLKVSDNAKKLIANEGFDEKFGARPIRKFIADKIETPISDLILSEKYVSGSEIVVQEEKKKILLS